MKYESMISPFEYKEFTAMNNDETKKYFNWFISQVEYRIEYLNHFIINDGETLELNYSVNSLIPLWNWYEGKIQVECKKEEDYLEEVERVPLWFQSHISREKISNDTLKIALDVSIYFAEVLIRNNPDRIRWGYFTKPKKRESVNQPTLLGFVNDMDLNPRIIVLTCTRKSSEERNPNRLLNAYNTWIKFLK